MADELDEEQRAFLERLADRAATSAELAEDLDVPLETVHSYVRQLRPRGFVRRETRGGRTTYRITRAGRHRLD